MIVKFVARGRLGNAIFRYMASAIICIIFNAEYSVENLNFYTIDMNDQKFLNIANNSRKYIEYILLLLLIA